MEHVRLVKQEVSAMFSHSVCSYKARRQIHPLSRPLREAWTSSDHKDGQQTQLSPGERRSMEVVQAHRPDKDWLPESIEYFKVVRSNFAYRRHTFLIMVGSLRNTCCMFWNVSRIHNFRLAQKYSMHSLHLPNELLR